MAQAQHRGVERQPRRPAALARAVAPVAEHGMPRVRELHADLVLATRLERELDQRVVAAPRADPHVRHRELAAALGPGVPYRERRVLGQVGAQRLCVGLHDPAHERDVRAPGLVVLELLLQRVLDLGRLRQRDETRSLPVEPVHDEHALGRSPAREHPAHRRVERLRALTVGRHREQSRRLVDDEQVVVLVYHVQRAAAPGWSA
jgi:hypothetical protein